jgi:hypothetical protein
MWGSVTIIASIAAIISFFAHMKGQTDKPITLTPTVISSASRNLKPPQALTPPKLRLKISRGTKWEGRVPFALQTKPTRILHV